MDYSCISSGLGQFNRFEVCDQVVVLTRDSIGSQNQEVWAKCLSSRQDTSYTV